MGKSSSQQPVITDPNDPNYDPSKDPNFLDKVDSNTPDGTPPTGAEAIGGSDLPPGEVAPQAPYGYHPSGTPRTEPAPEEGSYPKCPSGVVISEGPFDTTTIPSGLSEPLTQECADFYNEKFYKLQSDSGIGPFPTNNPTEDYLKTDPDAQGQTGESKGNTPGGTDSTKPGE